MMKQYKALLFDLCGTIMQYRIDRMPTAVIEGKEILSTTPILYDCFKKYEGGRISFEAFHAAFIETTESIDRFREKSGEEILSATRFKMFLDRLGLQPGSNRKRLQQRLKALHLERVEKCLELLPEDRALLSEWKERYRIGLVTNFDDAKTVHKILKREEITDFFETITISAELGIRKPRPEIFLSAIENLNVAPEDTLFTGDSLEMDIVGAKTIGMDTAWISHGKALPAGGGKVDHRISQMNALSIVLA